MAIFLILLFLELIFWYVPMVCFLCLFVFKLSFKLINWNIFNLFQHILFIIINAEINLYLACDSIFKLAPD